MQLRMEIRKNECKSRGYDPVIGSFISMEPNNSRASSAGSYGVLKCIQGEGLIRIYAHGVFVSAV